jgi:hypothetical protein
MDASLPNTSLSLIHANAGTQPTCSLICNVGRSEFLRPGHNGCRESARR